MGRRDRCKPYRRFQLHTSRSSDNERAELRSYRFRFFQCSDPGKLWSDKLRRHQVSDYRDDKSMGDGTRSLRHHRQLYRSWVYSDRYDGCNARRSSQKQSCEHTNRSLGVFPMTLPTAIFISLQMKHRLSAEFAWRLMVERQGSFHLRAETAPGGRGPVERLKLSAR